MRAWERRNGRVADVMELNGDNLRRETLETRQRARCWPRPPTRCSSGLQDGPRGIVPKRKDSPYRSGRSLDWLKTTNRGGAAGGRRGVE
jgi:ATP-dependent DNA ligase